MTFNARLKNNAWFTLVSNQLCSKWLLLGPILLFIYQLHLPGQPIETVPRPEPSYASNALAAVYLCRRPVDDWRVQLILPGIEHYSVWLPRKKLHRGATAAGPGYPLEWVDEIYLDPSGGAEEWRDKGLLCEPIPHADPLCVERQLLRQQDEGRYWLTNHCQHKAIEVLTMCGGRPPSGDAMILL